MEKEVNGFKFCGAITRVDPLFLYIVELPDKRKLKLEKNKRNSKSNTGTVVLKLFL